jgi:hypothetical protein
MKLAKEEIEDEAEIAGRAIDLRSSCASTEITPRVEACRLMERPVALTSSPSLTLWSLALE